jgi:hypothetical protein
MKRISKTLLMMVIAFSSTIGTHGAVIISDDFDGSNGTGELNGKVADIGGAWTATSTIFSIGGGNLGTTGITSATKGYLSFTPTAGNIYTLSADLNVSTGSNDWLTIGFFNAGVGSPLSIFNGVVSMALIAGNGSYSALDNTLSSISGTSGTATTGAPHLLSLTLDTTGLNWSTSFSIDGGATLGSFTYVGAPTISGVFLGRFSNGNGSFDNFQLVNTIPEPSTYALMFLGLGMVVILKYRSRFAQSA